MTANGKEAKCPFCGSDELEEQTTDYLYSRDDKYLLVPNMPVLVCAACGMVYYRGLFSKRSNVTFLTSIASKSNPTVIFRCQR